MSALRTTVPAHAAAADRRQAVSRLVPRLPARAVSYERAGYALLFAGLLWEPLGLWLLLQTRASAALRSFAYRAVRRLPPADGAPPGIAPLAVYYAAYAGVMAAWSLPIGTAGYLIERHFGFSTESAAGLANDFGVGYALQLLWIPVFWCGYRLYAASPGRWWLWLWALLAPLLLFQTVLQPVVIAPLYNRYTPLLAGPLRTEIIALARRAGIDRAAVYVEDTSRRTTHVNAYVTGLGPSARIVINDTALRELPHDQLIAMLGHEMGHYVEHHVWFEFLTSVLGAGIFLGLAAWLLPLAVERWGRRWSVTGLLDPAGYPLVALAITMFLFLQAPIMNAETRYLEHRADRFGLRLTHLNGAMVRLFQGFVVRDYSDPDPPAVIKLWFYSHPPLKERIEFAASYGGRDGDGSGLAEGVDVAISRRSRADEAMVSRRACGPGRPTG